MRSLPLVVLAGCVGWTPTADVVGTELVGFDFAQVTLALQVHVDNPWPVGVEVVRYGYALEVGGRSVVEGEAADGITVPSRGSADVIVPIVVRWADLADVGGAEVPWSADAFVVVATPLGEREIPLAASGTLPVVSPPVVSLDGWWVGRDAVGVGLAVDLRLDAPPALPIVVERASVALTLDGEVLVGGSATTRPDGDDVIVGLRLGVSPSAGLNGAARLLAGQDVVAAFVVGADVRTPLGTAPFEHRIEQALGWR